MKKVGTFVKRKVAGDILLLPTGETAQGVNGLITLSEVGEFIWDHLEETKSFDELITLLVQDYDIDKETAARDVSAFLVRLLRAGMLRPTGENW